MQKISHNPNRVILYKRQSKIAKRLEKRVDLGIIYPNDPLFHNLSRICHLLSKHSGTGAHILIDDADLFVCTRKTCVNRIISSMKVLDRSFF